MRWLSFFNASTRADQSLACRTRIFSTVLARALVVLSSIVYEREDRKVETAAFAALKAKKYHMDHPSDTARYQQQRMHARRLLSQSEEPLHHLYVFCCILLLSEADALPHAVPLNATSSAAGLRT